eukprot:5402812-Prymnesium_polylepis.1
MRTPSAVDLGDEAAVDVVAVEEAAEPGRVNGAPLGQVFLREEEGDVAGRVAGVLVLDARHVLRSDAVEGLVLRQPGLAERFVEEGAASEAEVLALLRVVPAGLDRALDARAGR